MTWNTATPAGTDLVQDGDDIIRELKADIQTALRGNTTDGLEAKFPGSDTANPVFRYRGLKGTTGARPTAGQYGLYINTTLNTLQRDNGSSWEDVATLIPSGTKSIFYQAAAPTGWTRDTSANDKFLRVVSAGSPGTTGGTFTAMSGTTSSDGAHTHSVGRFDTTGSENVVRFFSGSFDSSDWMEVGASFSNLSTSGASLPCGRGTVNGSVSDEAAAVSSSDGAHTHTYSSTHGSAQHAYADTMIATKD